MIAWVRRVRKAVREDGQYRLGRYGTRWWHWSIQPWRWSAGVCNFGHDGHGWMLHLFCLWVPLPLRPREPKDDMHDSWGVTVCPGERCAHLNWGHRTKILHFPWAWEWVRTEHLMPDGSFLTVEKASRLPRRWGGGRKYLRPDGTLRAVPKDLPVKDHCEWVMPNAPGRYSESFPYRYRLRSGEVQVRTATVTGERMAWAWRLPWKVGVFWPRKVRTSIWVKFSGEVGEETGSYKGGVTGCGSDLLPGETPEQCLRRMERERTFD